MSRTVVRQYLWPLWLYELFLAVNGLLGGWTLFWLIVFTVIGSIQFTFKYSK